MVRRHSPGVVLGAFFVALAASLMSHAQSAIADPAPVDAVSNVASLEGSAFAHAAGLIRVNQAAGVGNEQANVAAIGVVRTASDAALATIVSQKASMPTGIRFPVRNRIIVSPGALQDASGLIQIDQTAGNGNASANAFSLRIHS